jgi:protein O-GlcNAc transferase
MFKQLVRSFAASRRKPAAALQAGQSSAELVERGAQAHRAGERAAARRIYLEALAADGANADALHLLGVLEHQERNYDDAIELIEGAIALHPRVADYHMNCALPYLARGQTAEAVACSREALRLRPAYPKAHENLLFALAFSDAAPATILEEHRNWYRANLLPGLEHAAAPANTPDARRRLRVGYVSADFREHVVARFIEPVFANHDRAEFEVYAYDAGTGAGEVNARLRGHAVNWRTIHDATDGSVVELVRHDGIDLLVDLAGHTLGGRLGVFARRPVPVQLTYLGYPGTTGVPEIGYRITDAVCDPPGLTDAHYTERLLRLPGCLVCYLPPDEIVSAPAVPAEANGFVTFGSFNQPAKLSDGVLALWARLMREVPASRLLLAQMPVGFTRERYLAIFAGLGIPADRIEFAPRLPPDEYQALRDRVDIALDPFPMNGGSTTCETLWMGVPLVTLAGDRFVSRVGASMLSAAGLAECIANDEDEYLEIALRLARDLPRLRELRLTLRTRMRASSLMDGALFTRNLEALYRGVWRDWCETHRAA